MQSTNVNTARWYVRAFLPAVILSVVILGSGVQSYAAPLIVGSPQFPVASEGGQPSPGATIIAGPLTLPFVGFGFTGTLTSTVWGNDTTNPFIGGNPNARTFTYQLTNNATSANVIHRLTVGSYADTPAILTDVSFDPGTPGVTPTLADRSTVDVIGFSFADPITGIPQLLGNIPPGGQSKLLVVQTNTEAWKPSTASVIDGTVATVATFAPVTQIPEPSTCILAGIGLVGLVIGMARRRR